MDDLAANQERRDEEFQVRGQVIQIQPYEEEQARDFVQFVAFIQRYRNLPSVRGNTTDAQLAALHEYVRQIHFFSLRNDMGNDGTIGHHALPMSLFLDRIRRPTDFTVRVTHAEHVELHRLLAIGMVHHQGLYGIYRRMMGMPDAMSHFGALGGRATVATHGDQIAAGGRVGGLASVTFKM